MTNNIQENSQKEEEKPTSIDQDKKSKTILSRLDSASKATQKMIKWTKNTARVALAAVTLGTAAYIGKQFGRSDKQIKEDSKVIRKEELPKYYPNSPVRKESADFGSRVAEGLLTGEYPQKSPEEIKEEAEKIKAQIDEKESGIRNKSATLGNRLAQWIRGARQ